MKNWKKWLKRGILALFCLGITGGLAVFGLSSFVKNRTADKIVNETEAANRVTNSNFIYRWGGSPKNAYIFRQRAQLSPDKLLSL